VVHTMAAVDAAAADDMNNLDLDLDLTGLEGAVSGADKSRDNAFVKSVIEETGVIGKSVNYSGDVDGIRVPQPLTVTSLNVDGLFEYANRTDVPKPSDKRNFRVFISHNNSEFATNALDMIAKLIAVYTEHPDAIDNAISKLASSVGAPGDESGAAGAEEGEEEEEEEGEEISTGPSSAEVPSPPTFSPPSAAGAAGAVEGEEEEGEEEEGEEEEGEEEGEGAEGSLPTVSLNGASSAASSADLSQLSSIGSSAATGASIGASIGADIGAGRSSHRKSHKSRKTVKKSRHSSRRNRSYRNKKQSHKRRR